MSKTQYVMPPDSGSTNNGVAPSIGNCGRGIPRTGDIRHIGDCVPYGQTQTLTPGTIGQNVLGPIFDNDNTPFTVTNHSNRGLDAQAAVEADATAGSFGGFDASGEGFDPYSGKQGGQA